MTARGRPGGHPGQGPRRRGRRAAPCAATAGTGALGLYALERGDRRRRYLGRGLLAGSGLSACWLIGGLAHLTHEGRVERAWRRYLEGPVQVAPAFDATRRALLYTAHPHENAQLKKARGDKGA